MKVGSQLIPNDDILYQRTGPSLGVKGAKIEYILDEIRLSIIYKRSRDHWKQPAR